jgi:lambda family phage portal protein
MGARDFIRSILRRPASAPVDAAFIGRLVDQAGAKLLARRSFDAGETPPWTSSWSSTGNNLNLDLERSLVSLVKRSRGLSVNNDWARRLMIQLRTKILGPAGFTLQMRMVDQRGELMQQVNAGVEKFWSQRWGRKGNCEVTGQYSWQDCERILLDHLARDGEWLYRKLPGRGPFGFQIQILDPLLLDPTFRGDHNGNRIRMSVEIDAENRRVAYWLLGNTLDGDYYAADYAGARRIRVPAEEIGHFFLAETADQLRGFPWITAGARRLWLVKDFEEAAAVASSNAAKRVGFFVSPTGEAPPGFADQLISVAVDAARAQGKTLSASELQAIQSAAQQFATTAPGQYDTLPHGYDFKAHDSQYPHINYGEYVKECIRGFSAGVGFSHATLGNNLENVNLSSARIGVLDERELFMLLQAAIESHLHADVFRHALRYGQLTARDLVTFPPALFEDALDAAVWQKRRWAGLDPSKEADADETNLANKTTSRRRIIAARGEDPDEVFAEIEAEEKRFGAATPRPAKTAEPEKEEAGDTESSSKQRAQLVRVRSLS